MSKYQLNLGQKHWTLVKYILKYFKRMRDYMLLFYSDELVPKRYIDSNFQSNKDSCWSISNYILNFFNEVISWRSVK